MHGCSTALHLALRGLKPILVEKDYAGRHASGVNAGGVRQLARHLAEIPLSIASMEMWEQHRGAGRRRLRLREPRHGAGGRERGRSSAGFRARVDDLRLHGLHPRGADRPRRAEAPGAGGRRSLPGRRGLAARRRRRSVPHHAGLPPARHRARRRGDRGRDGHRPRARRRRLAGRDQRRADRGAQGGERRRRLGRPDRRAMLGEPVPLERDRADADGDQPAAGLHRAGGDPARPQALLQAARQRHGGDRRRPSRDAVSRRNRTVLDWSKLATSARTVWELFPAMRAATIVRAWAGIEARMPDDIPVVGPSAHVGRRVPPVRLLGPRLPARARHRRGDGRAGRHRRDQPADRRPRHRTVQPASPVARSR